MSFPADPTKPLQGEEQKPLLNIINESGKYSVNSQSYLNFILD